MNDKKREATPGEKDPRAEALRANLLKRKLKSRNGRRPDAKEPPKEPFSRQSEDKS